MKKVIAILMVVIFMFIMVGCKEIQINNNKNVKINNEDTDIRFWIDTETGVQYVIYNHGAGYKGMGGITPRLNADGTLYIAHPTEKGGEG